MAELFLDEAAHFLVVAGRHETRINIYPGVAHAIPGHGPFDFAFEIAPCEAAHVGAVKVTGQVANPQDRRESNGLTIAPVNQGGVTDLNYRFAGFNHLYLSEPPRA